MSSRIDTEVNGLCNCRNLLLSCAHVTVGYDTVDNNMAFRSVRQQKNATYARFWTDNKHPIWRPDLMIEKIVVAWWRHQMETISALLVICAGNLWPVNSPHKGQWRGVLMVFFYLRLNKLLSKQLWGWWFEMPSRPLLRHSNGIMPLDCETSPVPQRADRNEMHRYHSVPELIGYFHMKLFKEPKS